jgi:hypothetical protein
MSFNLEHLINASRTQQKKKQTRMEEKKSLLEYEQK